VSTVSDPFPQLRPALAPSLQDASPAEIRRELAREGIDAEAAEDFFGALGRAASSIGSAVGPRMGAIGQGALQGATAGMALGPYGAIAGAIGGAALGGLSAPSRTSGGAPSAGGVPASGIGGMAGLLGGGGASGGSGSGVAGLLGALGGGGRPGAGGPAASLLGLFTQPQVIQALMSMVLGSSGSRTVPVAGQPVPVAAIPNMIAQFAHQAASEWEQAYGVPETATLPGLSESADSAERAQALAQSIAVDAVVREAIETARDGSGRPEGGEQEGFEAEAAEFEAAEAEAAEWLESTEGYYASYEPVYARA
jgi:hypothetical protein